MPLFRNSKKAASAPQVSGPFQTIDPLGPTQPAAPVAQTQPAPLPDPQQPQPEPFPAYPPPTPAYESLEAARRQPVVRPSHRPQRFGGCCLVAPLVLLVGLALLLLYFFAPARTNILVLGIDARPGEGVVGRSDTMILTTVIPLKPYVGALFIPRDLWVEVPGHGQNRINTAHFFAESEEAGSGPLAAMAAVRDNFGVNIDYYVRLRFTGFKDAVDAIGGVDVEFPEGTSGYSAGVHHLNGEEALALVRDRSGDDFFRLQRGQLFMVSLYRKLAQPASWKLLPAAASKLAESVDTNLPIWQWPRLGLALLRAGADGIDFRSITREMVNPFQTEEGAQVLAPNWTYINPLLLEMFGQ